MALATLPVRHAAIIVLKIGGKRIVALKGLLKRFLVDLKSEPRLLGQLDVAVHDLPIVYQNPPTEGSVNLLLYQEIGNAGIQLQTGGKGDRPDGRMGCQVDIVGLGQGGDLREHALARFMLGGEEDEESRALSEKGGEGMRPLVRSPEGVPRGLFEARRVGTGGNDLSRRRGQPALEFHRRLLVGLDGHDPKGEEDVPPGVSLAALDEVGS